MHKVCFVTPGALVQLREAEGTIYGGSETRAWRLAKGLAERGFAVSITAFAGEVPSAQLLGNIDVIRDGSPANRWSWLMRRLWLREEHPHETLWARANADVYVAFGAADYNAALARWCRAAGRVLLLCAGNESDFSADYRPGNTARNAWGSRCDLCYEAMTSATAVTVQTRTQQRLLLERFGREALVIRNPAPLPIAREPKPPGRHVLWAGKTGSIKRPDLALELARRCPDVSFRLIANEIRPGDIGHLKSAAPSNVSIAESVKPSDMASEYEDAFALLSTSLIEGFPNTFLEAGALARPILTLEVDPDGVIAAENAGFAAAGDVETLAATIRRFAADPSAAQAAGRRMQDYVRREHDPDARIADFARLVSGLAGSPTAHDHSRTVPAGRSKAL